MTITRCIRTSLLSQGAEEGEAEATTSPEKVVLNLSEDTGKDGLLEVWEIMDLELNAQLVVLSACETARAGWQTARAW
jgi:CHAT domain-containing protein